MDGCLAVDAAVERIQLVLGLWVDVVRDVVPNANRVSDELLERARWEQSRVYRYEKYVDEPRLGGWLPRDAPHPVLHAVRAWLNERYGVQFDGGALARYRGATDSVGFHRDRELKWL